MQRLKNDLLNFTATNTSTREHATLRNGISRILGKNRVNLSRRKQIGGNIGCIGDSPVKTFFPNWVILIIHNEPLHLTAKSIYATFTSYPMKRVSKFHSVPCILTLAQQLYSVIHRGHIYIYIYGEHSMISLYHRYSCNNMSLMEINHRGGRSFTRYVSSVRDERIKKSIISTMMPRVKFA